MVHGKESAVIQETHGEDPLEKEMATHSSTLAWRIPWREKPGRLTFRVLTHCYFIFVYDVKECPNLILLKVAVQFSQNHLSRRLYFLLCVFLPISSYIS